MMLKIGAILAIIASYVVTIILAKREGKKAEQVANLRRELERNAKEQARAQSIIDNIRSMDDNDVANRLSNISKCKQR